MTEGHSHVDFRERNRVRQILPSRGPIDGPGSEVRFSHRDEKQQKTHTLFWHSAMAAGIHFERKRLSQRTAGADKARYHRAPHHRAAVRFDVVDEIRLTGRNRTKLIK